MAEYALPPPGGLNGASRAAHIIGADLSTPLAWGQAAGKTLSCAVFGLTLLILYWKTRNIRACGVVHGVYDFLLSFSDGIFQKGTIVAPYVLPDEAALPVIIIYSVTTVIELFLFWIVWRKVGRKIDFEEMRRSW